MGARAIKRRTYPFGGERGLRELIGNGVALDSFGLACYIAYSYLFWDSPLLLDQVHLATGESIAHQLLLVQGLFTGLASLLLMVAWGRVTPLRHNAALVTTLAGFESLAVVLACGGWGDAAIGCSLIGFAMSGFGSAMRLGWEERFSVRGVPAVALRAGLAYLIGTILYILCVALVPGDVALVVIGVLPCISLILLLWSSQGKRDVDVVPLDSSIEPLGPQESLRTCFARVPWRIPAFVALSYACFGATRMNMLADSLMTHTSFGALTPAVAMVACTCGIVLAYVSYHSSVQAGICIAVPIIAAAGLVNLIGGAQSSVAILFVTNVGVEITKYIMLFLMVDVIVKDGAPALMCLAILRFAQWMGSAIGQAIAKMLPSGMEVLVVILLALMAALIVIIVLPSNNTMEIADAVDWTETILESDASQDLISVSQAMSVSATNFLMDNKDSSVVDDPHGNRSSDNKHVQDTHTNRFLEARIADDDELDTFSRHYGLSPREREVLEVWITGRPAEYVEKTLFISKSTVKTHLTHIYAKTGTTNRATLLDLLERESHQ